MRHHKKGRILKKTPEQRRELLRSLSRHLILRGSIMTTEARAKEMRPYLERMVTYAKKGTLSGRRMLLASFKNDSQVVRKLMQDIAPKYKERAGGYLRVIKTSPRKSDSARRAVISFV
ncbi:MAG: 50S ribosomal protein L17 [Patescibacteria group bacterium]